MSSRLKQNYLNLQRCRRNGCTSGRIVRSQVGVVGRIGGEQSRAYSTKVAHTIQRMDQVVRGIIILFCFDWRGHGSGWPVVITFRFCEVHFRIKIRYRRAIVAEEVLCDRFKGDPTGNIRAFNALVIFLLH